MSAPETDWVDGIIPPARYWRVVHRYIGVSSGRIFDDPDACFTSDAICRRIYSRYPTDRDGNYQPLTSRLDTGPIHHPNNPPGDGSHEDPRPDPDPDPLRGDDAGGAGDGDGGSDADQLRADNGDARHAGGVLLDGGPADTESDPDASTVRDTRAADALSEGELR